MIDNNYSPLGNAGQCAKPIDFYTSQYHFAEHLAPTWLALPPDRRGTFRVSPTILGRVKSKLSIPDALPLSSYGSNDGPAVVASYTDLCGVIDSCYPRPLIMSEHGAGFTFSNGHTSYAGGRGQRKHVSLFLCTNEYVKKANLRTYPGAMAAIVGCPKMDAAHNQAGIDWQSPYPSKPNPTIAFSFHWNCMVCPETRSAYNYYKRWLKKAVLAFPNARFIGHGHPRIIRQLVPLYKSIGITDIVYDFEEVLSRADLYVNDSSSTIYEFASINKPVVVLNSPDYRRNVNHGLRFWEHANVGVQCSYGKDLVGSIRTALQDTPRQLALRKAATSAAYPVRGNAASVAAGAILSFADKMVPGATSIRAKMATTARAVVPAPAAPARKRAAPNVPPNPVERAASTAIKNIPGLMSTDELATLCSMVLSAKNVVELGVWKGRSLAGMMLTNPAAKFCGVDWFHDMSHLGYQGSSEQTVRDNLASVGIKNVRIIAKPSAEAALDYNEKIDFLHVDAGHSIEEVQADIALWLPKVVPGGAVAFHDYGETKKKVLNRPGVTSTVDAWRNDDWTEVARAGRQVVFRNIIAPRGILYIAYGAKAREGAKKAILAASKYGLPIAVVSDTPLGAGGEHFIYHADTHPGARRQKTSMYALSPFAETLYMDADTILLQDPASAFGLLRWFDVVASIDMAGNTRDANWQHLDPDELATTKRELPSLGLIYYNSGVLCFRRSAANLAMFTAWHKEWLRWRQHDQLSLARAMIKHPVRIAPMRRAWNSNKREEAKFVFHAHHSVRREGAPL